MRVRLIVWLLCVPWFSAACVCAFAEEPKDLLPAKIRDAGVVNVAANATYPPFAFNDANGESSGVEPDLMRAIAAKLGIKAVFTGLEFVTIMPSIQAGRFEVGLGGFFDTPARREVARFIDYMYAVDGLVTRVGNPDHISIVDLCGKSVSGSESSTEVTNLLALSKQCTDQGKPAIDVVVLKGTPAQIVAVNSGRVAAACVTKAVTVYIASQSGAGVESLPGIVPEASGVKQLDGIMVRKEEPELAQAMTAAMDALIADGTYAAIFKKWGLPRDLALPRAILH
jgi:polar amino acid transport system substrate-binding protein